MMMNSPSMPPPLPSDAALTYALTLLGIASDPNGTRERMNQLVAQLEAVHAAVAEHDAAAAKAAEVAAAQEVLTARAAAVAEREAALGQRQTQIDVAAAALGERESAVKTRELAADDREAALAKDTAGLAARIESYKAALSA